MDATLVQAQQAIEEAQRLMDAGQYANAVPLMEQALTIQQGILKVTAASTTGDSVAVWYSDAYQTVYYELAAKVSMDKPTGGWKANAYIIFDYFSPTDFKYAGVDQSTNKMVIGYRDATGWHPLSWGSVPGGVKAGTFYNLNVVVNGLVVTVTIDGKNAFSYTFAPRMLNGKQVALNKGLVGFGSDKAKGWFDNIALTVISPEITIDRADYFEGSTPVAAVTTQQGTWSTTAGRYEGAAAGGSASALLGIAGAGGDPAFGGVPQFDPLTYIELEATFKAIGTSGFMFDWYSNTDYKFVALDVAGKRIIVGHVDGAARVIDWSIPIAQTITPGGDYLLNIVIKANVVTVSFAGQVLASVSYNAQLGDGRQGVFGLGTGTVVSIADYRIRTDDDAYLGSGPPLQSVSITDVAVTEGAAGTTKTVTMTVTRSSGEGALTMGWVLEPTGTTATKGADFTAPTNQTVYFAPGQTTATITFTVIGDAVVEPDETFVVRLQPNPAANLKRAAGVVRIVNDDTTVKKT